MYFLIDYENVNYAGLEGTEFLEKEDTVIFFFGEGSDKIVNYRVADIEKSGCHFEICKLKNVRKNALDFYIASKVGEIFALDRDAKVAIISTDKDHQSVIDYWKARLAEPNQLIRSKNIAKGILFTTGEAARKKMVREKIKIVDLQVAYAHYEERNHIAQMVEKLLSGSEYEGLTSQIVDMILEADRPRVLYINSLKSFGRKRGTEVYRKIRNYAVSFAEEGDLHAHQE